MLLQDMIDYYEQRKQQCVRLMNKHCSEFWGNEAIKYSKMVDALNTVKADGVFK